MEPAIQGKMTDAGIAVIAPARQISFRILLALLWPILHKPSRGRTLNCLGHARLLCSFFQATVRGTPVCQGVRL